MYKYFIVFISDGISLETNSQDYDNKDFKNFWIEYNVLQNMLSILLRNPSKGFERK